MSVVIQHNIMALNANNRLTTNNGKVSKNLEKLSSGYRINRAADDAAGLAISERMRAQITGLDRASENAQDGISLVQTGEGALTEVHSMLDRMAELATQAANGTYDNEVDRANLQDELDSLKGEIDRIAESTNFNGINLLDGSLGAAASVTTTPGETDGFTYTASNKLTTLDLSNAWGVSAGDAVAVSVEQPGNSHGTADIASLDGVTFSFNSGENSEALNGYKFVFSMSASSSSTASVDTKTKTVAIDLKGDDKVNDYPQSGGGSNMANQIEDALKALGGDWANVAVSASKSDFDNNSASTAPAASDNPVTGGSAEGHKITVDIGGNKYSMYSTEAPNTTDEYTLTSESNGSIKIKLGNTSVEDDVASGEVSGTAGVPATTTLGFAPKTGADVIGASIKIGDTTYEFVESPGVPSGDNTAIQLTGDVSSEDIAKALFEKLPNPLNDGYVPEFAAPANIVITAPNGNADPFSVKQLGKGLGLQIGDTAEQRLTVKVGDMHSEALGLGDISIGGENLATRSIKPIKNAINIVSSTRADLGAVQNRLEHTINNLTTTGENLSASESRIRDTDMAEEMMNYTKNNVLSQAAQAMLAQANQQPQQVLQLIQT